jgi:hypothetical protein
MWRRVDLVLTYISEERIASIFRVEKCSSEKPAWAVGCSLQSTLKMESIRFSQRSVHTRSTRRHLSENCFQFIRDRNKFNLFLQLERFVQLDECRLSVPRSEVYCIVSDRRYPLRFYWIVSYRISCLAASLIRFNNMKCVLPRTCKHRNTDVRILKEKFVFKFILWFNQRTTVEALADRSTFRCACQMTILSFCLLIFHH